MVTRKELRRTLTMSSIIIFILAIVSAALKEFNTISNAKAYAIVQAVVRSLILFFFLVLFSSFQQLRRRYAGIVEFFLSRIISLVGFGLVIGGCSEKLLGRGVFLVLAFALTAYVLAQGFEVK